MVCEDTSRKVKAAFKAKFATGQRIGAYAPIGYRKHPEIKNKLIIDEETRWIVEKIFDLAIHGRGAAQYHKNTDCGKGSHAGIYQLPA